MNEGSLTERSFGGRGCMERSLMEQVRGDKPVCKKCAERTSYNRSSKEGSLITALLRMKLVVQTFPNSFAY